MLQPNLIITPVDRDESFDSYESGIKSCKADTKEFIKSSDPPSHRVSFHSEKSESVQ